jgi:hypothetical protein
MLALTTIVPGTVEVSVFPPLIVASVIPITVQVMFWLVAFQGDTVPVRLRGVPTVAVEGTPLIFVTGTKVEGGGNSPPPVVQAAYRGDHQEALLATQVELPLVNTAKALRALGSVGE